MSYGVCCQCVSSHLTQCILPTVSRTDVSPTREAIWHLFIPFNVSFAVEYSTVFSPLLKYTKNVDCLLLVLITMSSIQELHSRQILDSFCVFCPWSSVIFYGTMCLQLPCNFICDLFSVFCRNAHFKDVISEIIASIKLSNNHNCLMLHISVKATHIKRIS